MREEREYGITVVNPKKEEEATKLFRKVKKVEDLTKDYITMATSIGILGSIGVGSGIYALSNIAPKEDPILFGAFALSILTIGIPTATMVNLYVDDIKKEKAKTLKLEKKDIK